MAATLSAVHASEFGNAFPHVPLVPFGTTVATVDIQVQCRWLRVKGSQLDRMLRLYLRNNVQAHHRPLLNSSERRKSQ